MAEGEGGGSTTMIIGIVVLLVLGCGGCSLVGLLLALAPTLMTYMSV